MSGNNSWFWCFNGGMEVVCGALREVMGCSNKSLRDKFMAKN